ncbi:MAG: hypothetical protein GY824_02605, partial [Delftia sp.]|nr:hypothetical protein [Delftia sp.]
SGGKNPSNCKEMVKNPPNNPVVVKIRLICKEMVTISKNPPNQPSGGKKTKTIHLNKEILKSAKSTQ